MSNRANAICKRENEEADTYFALKAMLKFQPFKTLIITVLVSNVIFALAIRMAERPVYEPWDTDITKS